MLRVSAIIPTYNSSRSLRRAIDSVLAQSAPVDELIVIDDGSTDDTAAVVASYGAAVRYLYQPNAGAAAARNVGVLEAGGEWIAFLDHDDEWLPAKIERQSAAIQACGEAVACYSWMWFNTSAGERLARLIPPSKFWPGIRWRNPMVPSVLMVRRDALLESGGFAEKLRTACEDWDLVIRLARRYPDGFVLVEEPLAKYYFTEANTSNRYEMMLQTNLSIVDSSLVCDFRGLRRALWRRRVRSMMFYQAAVGARAAGASGLRHLLRSFLEWPAPTFEPVRLKTLGVELLGR